MKCMRRSAPPMLALSAATAFAFIGAIAPATEAQAATSSQSTTANVTVGSAITLSNLTPSFTLTGNPGDTLSTSITMTVATNNFTGYTVTVQAAGPTLTPSISGSVNSIPIGSLNVRESVTGIYAALSAVTPVVVHSQAVASTPSGDNLTNDYRITIPFVRGDTYTGTLSYVATTL
jgi:hypothetical protein